MLSLCAVILGSGWCERKIAYNTYIFVGENFKCYFSPLPTSVLYTVLAVLELAYIDKAVL